MFVGALKSNGMARAQVPIASAEQEKEPVGGICKCKPIRSHLKLLAAEVAIGMKEEPQAAESPCAVQ